VALRPRLAAGLPCRCQTPVERPLFSLLLSGPRRAQLTRGEPRWTNVLTPYLGALKACDKLRKVRTAEEMQIPPTTIADPSPIELLQRLQDTAPAIALSQSTTLLRKRARQLPIAQ
jgi:hypothetical protein